VRVPLLAVVHALEVELMLAYVVEPLLTDHPSETEDGDANCGVRVLADAAVYGWAIVIESDPVIPPAAPCVPGVELEEPPPPQLPRPSVSRRSASPRLLTAPVFPARRPASPDVRR
jgi:hypothetical protein